MKRLVYGAILKPDGKPYTGTVVFKFTGSFSATAQYPPESVFAVVNGAGNFEVELWANQEGEIQSKYICYLSNDKPFEFSIPPGNTPISLSALRLAGVLEHSPEYQSILAFAEQAAKDAVAQLGGLAREPLTAANGHTVFVLSRSPNPLTAQLFLNGVKAVYGQDYMIDGNTINWITNDPLIDVSDQFEIYY